MIGRKYCVLILIILFFYTSISSALSLDLIVENKNVNDNKNSTMINIAPLNHVSTIFVDDNQNPGWYDSTHVRTIQEGVNNASRYWTIFVFNGTYYENVLIHEKINLIGEDKNVTIIDCKDIGGALSVLVDDVKISGFTIRNSSKNVFGDSWGILTRSNNNTITNNIISNNGVYGIYLYKSSNNKISNNIITKNKFLILGMGIQLIESSNNTLDCNTITRNRLGGICLYNSNNNMISRNTISKHINLHHQYGGITIVSSNYNKVSNNIITRNRMGIVIGSSEDNDVINNTIIFNRKGITIFKSTNNIVSHNNFILNIKNAEFRFKHLINSNNKWDNNYWNRPRLLPYPIIGKKIITSPGLLEIKIPLFVKFDWHPAKKPYHVT